ncbi:methyltransferase [Actinoplanes ianthinogenes]|uniref:Methyltransferase n=1 Tax=Actinoplanes ianthinogenes TaxID=122358 RepID=A0ABM7LR83_9ACTN|nr:class I SAM-dependent methyltransferase [Actinoplanes ianthinogenes]BCJ41792.1 methyltransferase [Actinoplanes ianthinogenes]GGR44980.1 methyltransferase [Actinoplanes ianthinogenes]
MPDAIFADDRLAALYDHFDADRGDLPAYLAIIDELGATRIVDVGCGTGTLAVLLAASGRTVIGADPALASLGVAERKPGAGRVTWLHAGAAGLVDAWAGREPADLAVMTANVAQVFLSDDDWTAALRGIRGVLRRGGHVVFEARRPEFRGWEEWVTTQLPTTLEIPGIGPVERRFTLGEVRLPLVSFRFEYRFHADGAVVTSESTLRFRSRAEIEESLDAAGFAVLEVRDAPDRPGRENVFIARAVD